MLAAVLDKEEASESAGERPRTRWLVAGAVAGVVSATGVAYLAARRHHRGAA